MHILLTGGAGYIGSVTTRILLEANHSVTVLDNLKHGHENTIPANVRLIKSDLRDFARVVSADDNFDAVVHLAALISVKESVDSPKIYWENNVTQTEIMLAGMKKLGISNLVFASTAAVYGDPDHVPIREDDTKKPTSPYGETKLAMDEAITKACVDNELSATSLRFFNVAGAYKNAGEQHEPETHLIPIALQVAAGERKQLELYGTDYPTKDGTCVRDYIHVADLADAIALALSKQKNGIHQIYNLGNGNGFTNREVIDTVKKITGRELNVTEKPRRDGDPATLVASSEKAKQELGWRPRRAELETMIHNAWDFYQTTRP